MGHPRIASRIDGLSGAASIISVVSIASGFTQAIYNIVSSIQSSSNIVQQMVSNLQTSSSLLQQLLRISDSFYLASDLLVIIRKCATSLKVLEEKLERPSSMAETKAMKFIKNIKVTLQLIDFG